MSVPKPDDVANHGHDSSGSGVTLSDVPPLIGSCAGAPNLSAKRQNILRMHVLVLSLHIFWHGLLICFPIKTLKHGFDPYILFYMSCICSMILSACTHRNAMKCSIDICLL